MCSKTEHTNNRA